MTPADFERLVVERTAPDRYVLRLYVTGMTARSTEAVATVTAICEQLLAGHCDLSVVDLYQDPGGATQEQIVASPTLVKEAPAPERRLIGSMADRARVVRALGLEGREEKRPDE